MSCGACENDSPKEGKLIGKIIHYYGNIGVGIIELVGDLSVGDTIRVKGGSIDFEQKIESMQIEHKDIQKAKKGQSVGLKVKEKVKEGDEVYRL